MSREKVITPALQNWISAEITTQLRELKEQIMREVEEEISAQLVAIRKDISTQVRRGCLATEARVETKMDEKVAATSGQIVLANQTSARDMHNMVITATEKIQANIYGRVIKDITAVIAPQVTAMTQWVNQKTEDGQLAVDKYRRDLDREANGHRGNPARGDSRYVSEGVSLFL